jgi:hypothetical protein
MEPNLVMRISVATLVPDQDLVEVPGVINLDLFGAMILKKCHGTILIIRLLLSALSADISFAIPAKADSVENGIAADFAIYDGFLLITVLGIKLHPDDFAAERTLNLKVCFHI